MKIGNQPWDRWARERHIWRQPGATPADIPYVRKKVNRRAWDDCVINTISILTGRPWMDVFREFCNIGYAMMAMPFDDVVVHKFMSLHGYPKISCIRQSTEDVREFAGKHPTGRYALRVESQYDGKGSCDTLTALVDGVNYGSRDDRMVYVQEAFEITDSSPAMKVDPAEYVADESLDIVDKALAKGREMEPGSWVEAKVNPHGTDDCVANAFCFALHRSWREVFCDMCRMAAEISTMPHAYKVFRPLMERQGFPQVTLRTGPHRLVGNFAKEHPEGTFILECTGHNTVVIDGVNYNGCSDCRMCRIKRAYQVV